MRFLVRFLGFFVVVACAATGASAGVDLARQKNCLACHAVDRPLLGPSYRDVALANRGKPDAVERLTRKVLQGGSGAWGSVPMPSNPVTPAEARQLVEWVLTLWSPEAVAAAASAAAAPAVVPSGSRQTTGALPARHYTEQSVQRGRYLVEGVLACGNCHTPRAADTSPIAGKELSGGRTYDTPDFYVTPGNLTSDAETGLGRWSDEDLKRALTQGVRPNGLPLAPMMPVAFMKALTPEDLDGVLAYLRSLPPIRNPTPPPVYKKPTHADPYPDAEHPPSRQAMAEDRLLRGRYLAALAHCMDCHTPVVEGASNYERDGGKGGKRMGVARVPVPNITSHPTAGIGAWSDDEIRRALVQGIARDGRKLQYPMPWPYLATLNAADVDSLVAWLRSLPPKQ